MTAYQQNWPSASSNLRTDQTKRLFFFSKSHTFHKHFNHHHSTTHTRTHTQTQTNKNIIYLPMTAKLFCRHHEDDHTLGTCTFHSVSGRKKCALRARGRKIVCVCADFECIVSMHSHRREGLFLRHELLSTRPNIRKARTRHANYVRSCAKTE